MNFKMNLMAAMIALVSASTAMAQFHGTGRTSNDPFDNSRDPNRPLTPEGGYRGAEQPWNRVPETVVKEMPAQKFDGPSISPSVTAEKLRYKVNNYIATSLGDKTVVPNDPQVAMRQLSSGSTGTIVDALKRSPLALEEAEKLHNIGKIAIVNGVPKPTAEQVVIMAKRLDSFLGDGTKAVNTPPTPFVKAMLGASGSVEGSYLLRNAKGLINGIPNAKLLKVLGGLSLAAIGLEALASESKGKEELNSLGEAAVTTTPAYKIPARANVQR